MESKDVACIDSGFEIEKFPFFFFFLFFDSREVFDNPSNILANVSELNV